MIKNLRIRLTMIFTLFTSCILFIILCFLLYGSIEAKREENWYIHNNKIATMANSVIYYDNETQRKYLNEIERNEKMGVVLLKDGQIVYQTDSWKISTNIEMLYEQVKPEEGGSEIPVYLTIMTMRKTEEMLEYVSGINSAEESSEDSQNGKNASDETIQASAEVSVEGGLMYYDYGQVMIETTNGSDITIVLTGQEGEKYEVYRNKIEVAGSSYFLNEEAEEGKYFLIEPDKKMEAYEAYFFLDLSSQNQEYMEIIQNYVFLFLAGAFMLLFVNYFLTRLAAKPTEKSLQDQTEFVAAASHELRNPLAVIRSSIAAAEISENEQEEKKYIDAADREAIRMSRLVDDLLLLAGGDTGKWKLRLQKVDLDTLLIETVEQIQTMVKDKQKKVKIHLELPEEMLGEICADKDRLSQVFTILLDNAIQYSPENETVTIKAQKEKMAIKIWIIDHGKGVAEKDKARIFDRFYRSDTSRTDKAHFGLGLSVAKELVEMHEGEIRLSDTVGGGATFEVMLRLKTKKNEKIDKK